MLYISIGVLIYVFDGSKIISGFWCVYVYVI